LFKGFGRLNGRFNDVFIVLNDVLPPASGALSGVFERINRNIISTGAKNVLIKPLSL
jgi:hypothetical protein